MSSLLLIVTGASRGLGQAIATAFCEHASGLSSIWALLVSRSQEGLTETEQQMERVATANGISLVATVHVMDLADLDTLDENIDKLLNEVQQSSSSSTFERVVIVSNAGSLGHLGPLTEMSSLRALQDNVNFNVTSSLWLSIRLVRGVLSVHTYSPCTVVNISSLCAIEPFPTMGVYCTGKAARDMFYKVWAKELECGAGELESKGCYKNVKLLSYAPGALETDMTDTLRQSTCLDPKLQTFYQEAHTSGDLISPNKTAERMVKLVWKNEFESGSHVDYWDLSGG